MKGLFYNEMIIENMQKNSVELYIQKYVEEMQCIAEALHNAVCPNYVRPIAAKYYQFEWLEDELENHPAVFEIDYKNKQWHIYYHSPHWEFTSHLGERIEVCYYDTRLIDAGFLKSYIETTLIDVPAISFQGICLILDELVEENKLVRVNQITYMLAVKAIAPVGKELLDFL